MIEHLHKLQLYRSQQTIYYQCAKIALASTLFVLISFSGDHILIAGLFAPSLIAIAATPLFSLRIFSKNTIAAAFISFTALFYLANQISNTPNAINLMSIVNIVLDGGSFFGSVLFQVWPAILWWIVGLIKKMRLELYILGFASTQLINWVISVELMRSDPRDALGWVVIIFVQPLMFVSSLAIYYARFGLERMINNKFKATSQLNSILGA